MSIMKTMFEAEKLGGLSRPSLGRFVLIVDISPCLYSARRH